MTALLRQSELEAAVARLADANAPELLRWVEARFGGEVVIAASFGVEDIALIDLAAQHAPSARIFTLDTGRLPPETYEVMERVRERYGPIECYFPERAQVEALESSEGLFSFRASVAQRQACCATRKVAPLERALAGKAAWLTGLRREQAPTRLGLPVLDLEAGGRLKVNPLAAWSTAETWAYVRERKLPYHPLHDRGYPSIGCAPCTRAIEPGEDLRAGRWWWEQSAHKECGLHARALPERRSAVE